MIASFQHGFVFVKTEKTAGTTVEIALTPLCGPNDILAPIALADERLRLVGGNVAARNFAPGDRRLEGTLREAIVVGDAEKMRQVQNVLVRHKRYFFNHMTATEMRTRLPERFWHSAFKFTVVRHPYERMVSYIAYAGGADLAADAFDATFEKLFAQIGRDHLRYTDGRRLIVDAVIRQENLLDDLNGALARLGLEPIAELPSAKGGYRKDRRPAREILSRPQKRRLQKLCAIEFDLFGYEK